MTRVAILNSRQSKTPVGDDPWVRQTCRAVQHTASQGGVVVSSVGLNTWELVTWLGGHLRAPLRLLVPTTMRGEERTGILRRFALDSSTVEFVEVPAESSRSAKSWWNARDRAIVAQADRIVPVSVRHDGTLAQLLAGATDREIDPQFRVPYNLRSHHERVRLDSSRLNPELQTWSGDWLIHWTRACHGPWPGESDADYYADLVNSTGEYCRSAIRTLARIVREGRIRGSAWRIGARATVVAFTALPPPESLSLVRWRPRWSRWSFEPYGIAIRRDALMAAGARAVQYVDERQWRALPDDAKPLAHRRGKKSDIWPAEREWRTAGDLSLDQLPSDAVRLLVRSAADTAMLPDGNRFCVTVLERD
ncbi:MAG TPA: hypothetical protein VNN55_08345 [bacterium]|nr:hypothetical protein [bacterium]